MWANDRRCSGIVSDLVRSLGVLCVFLYVPVFAYVGGCGSCCLPNVLGHFLLSCQMLWDTKGGQESNFSLAHTHICCQSLLLSLPTFIICRTILLSSGDNNVAVFSLITQMMQICYKIEQQKCLQCRICYVISPLSRLIEFYMKTEIKKQKKKRRN